MAVKVGPKIEQLVFRDLQLSRTTFDPSQTQASSLNGASMISVVQSVLSTKNSIIANKTTAVVRVFRKVKLELAVENAT